MCLDATCGHARKPRVLQRMAVHQHSSSPLTTAVAHSSSVPPLPCDSGSFGRETCSSIHSCSHQPCMRDPYLHMRRHRGLLSAGDFSMPIFCNLVISLLFNIVHPHGQYPLDVSLARMVSSLIFVPVLIWHRVRTGKCLTLLKGIPPLRCQLC